MYHKKFSIQDLHVTAKTVSLGMDTFAQDQEEITEETKQKHPIPMDLREVEMIEQIVKIPVHQTQFLSQLVSSVFVAVHQDGLLVLTIKFALTHHNPKVTSRINDVILILGFVSF